MTAETFTFPAFLATALINGDLSGLTGDDHRWYDLAIETVDGGSIVSCGDDTFISRHCSLPGWHLVADMLDYTVLYPEAQ